MEKFGRKRRYLLKALTFSGLALLVGKFLFPKAAPQQVLLEVPRADIPPDGALVFRQARVAVIRQGEEVFALDLTCTHLGCTVSVTPKNLVCPCHGSLFARDGAVLSGPADQPLRRLALEEHGDLLTIYSRKA